MTVANDPRPGDDAAVVHWPAVLRGALVGLGVLVVVSVLEAALDRNLDSFHDSAWIYPLFVLVLLGYGFAGWTAGRVAPGSALTNGTLAGVGSFVLWIPVRIVIWLVRDEDRGLFTGHSPALRPGQVFAHLAIAAGLGMLGAYLGARSLTRTRRVDR
jgi:hypothetical protein